VQWHFAFPIPFRARNFRAIQSTRAAQSNSLRTEIHCGLHRLLHRAAVSDSSLDLQRHVLSDELSIELRRFDLLDIDLDLFSLRHLRDLFGHLLDFRAFTADHDSRTSSVNRYP